MKKQKEDREMLKNQQNIGTKKKPCNMKKYNDNSKNYETSFCRKVILFVVSIMEGTFLFSIVLLLLIGREAWPFLVQTRPILSSLQLLFDTISTAVLLEFAYKVFPIIRRIYLADKMNFGHWVFILIGAVIIDIFLTAITRPINTIYTLIGYLSYKFHLFYLGEVFIIRNT